MTSAEEWEQDRESNDVSGVAGDTVSDLTYDNESTSNPFSRTRLVSGITAAMDMNGDNIGSNLSGVPPLRTGFRRRASSVLRQIDLEDEDQGGRTRASALNLSKGDLERLESIMSTASRQHSISADRPELVGDTEIIDDFDAADEDMKQFTRQYVEQIIDSSKEIYESEVSGAFFKHTNGQMEQDSQGASQSFQDSILDMLVDSDPQELKDDEQPLETERKAIAGATNDTVVHQQEAELDKEEEEQQQQHSSISEELTNSSNGIDISSDAISRSQPKAEAATPALLDELPSDEVQTQSTDENGYLAEKTVLENEAAVSLMSEVMDGHDDNEKGRTELELPDPSTGYGYEDDDAKPADTKSNSMVLSLQDTDMPAIDDKDGAPGVLKSSADEGAYESESSSISEESLVDNNIITDSEIEYSETSRKRGASKISMGNQDEEDMHLDDESTVSITQSSPNAERDISLRLDQDKPPPHKQASLDEVLNLVEGGRSDSYVNKQPAYVSDHDKDTVFPLQDSQHVSHAYQDGHDGLQLSSINASLSPGDDEEDGTVQSPSAVSTGKTQEDKDSLLDSIIEIGDVYADNEDGHIREPEHTSERPHATNLVSTTDEQQDSKDGLDINRDQSSANDLLVNKPDSLDPSITESAEINGSTRDNAAAYEKIQLLDTIEPIVTTALNTNPDIHVHLPTPANNQSDFENATKPNEEETQDVIADSEPFGQDHDNTATELSAPHVDRDDQVSEEIQAEEEAELIEHQPSQVSQQEETNLMLSADSRQHDHTDDKVQKELVSVEQNFGADAETSNVKDLKDSREERTEIVQRHELAESEHRPRLQSQTSFESCHSIEDIDDSEDIEQTSGILLHPSPVAEDPYSNGSSPKNETVRYTDEGIAELEQSFTIVDINQTDLGDASALNDEDVPAEPDLELGDQEASTDSVEQDPVHTESDMPLAEPYRACFAHAGFMRGEPQQAIVVLSACQFPDKNLPDYAEVMDQLFTYIMTSLREIDAESYTILYLQGGARRSQLPNLTWLKSSHDKIDRRIRKSLKHLFIVHPTFWTRAAIFWARPFISSKFVSKIEYAFTLEDLNGKIPMKNIPIPSPVRMFDITKAFP